MFNIDRVILEQKAIERGFNRDVLEKVYRLEDILTFIYENPILGDLLVLKGGTAINLTVFGQTGTSLLCESLIPLRKFS